MTAGPAMNQGWRKGVLAQVQQTNPATRDKMREMLRYVRAGRQNETFRMSNRPGDIVGDSVDKRMRVLRDANRRAGSAIDEIADEQLSRVPFIDDVQPAVRQFLDDLKVEGVVPELDEAGNITGKLNYDDSSFEGLTDLQGLIDRTMNRLYATNKKGRLTALDAHRAKRFIDRQVSYGKRVTGLDGAVENTFKRLRRGIDQALDARFPDYDQANTTYAETVGVIDELQSLAGQRVDLLDKNASRAIGLMTRKLLSNYQATPRITTLVENIDNLANQYAPQGTTFNDNITELVSFDAELRRLLPDVEASNTFQGLTEASAMKAARVVADVADIKSGGIAGAFRLGKKLAGQGPADPEKQLDALEAFLSAQ